MKKILTSVILASGMILCASQAKAANNYNLTPEIANAYFNIVDGLAEKHDDYLLDSGDEMDADGLDMHFWDVRLVDFDNNTVPELFFIYDSENNKHKGIEYADISSTYQIWGWNGSNAYQIACENIEAIADTGAIDVTLLGLLNEDSRTYIPFMTHAGDADGLQIIEFYTLVNGVWKSVPEKRLYGEASQDEYYNLITLNAKIGNKKVSSKQFKNRWFEVKEKTINVWSDDYEHTKFVNFANEVNIPFKVTSNVEAIVVDGQPVELQAYNVGGSNYIRLRDIAAVMKDTQKPFDVKWLYNQIVVVKNTPYSGDKSIAISQSGVTKKTLSNIFYITQEQYLESLEHDILICEGYISARALKINDENYVKLRDVAKRINFGVDWDSNTKTVIIDSSKNYSA